MTRQAYIHLAGVSKSYREIHAVDDLDLEINQGEILGLLGPNGAGKTTTINLIAGFLKPDRGKIYWNGVLVNVRDQEYRKNIGICPQENVHWNKLTPVEQLTFLGQMYGLPKTQIDFQCQHLLEVLNLGSAAHRLAGKLSGGMQRRLNIALAMIHDPQILILDEPEAGLDPQSRICVREYIRSLANSKTVILTTHNMDEAQRMADRVAVIDQGRLLVLDTPEALVLRVGEGDVLELELNNPGVRRKLLALDLPEQLSSQVVGDMIQVRGLDLVNQLPVLLSRLEKQDLIVSEIRLRKNTLEDVFIQLTGRMLRE